MASVRELLRFIIDDSGMGEQPEDLIKKWNRKQLQDNPFARTLELEHTMIVDSRVYSAKLEDSYHMGRIMKWLLVNKPYFRENVEAFRGDVGAAILDVLDFFKEQEDKVDAIREIV